MESLVPGTAGAGHPGDICVPAGTGHPGGGTTGSSLAKAGAVTERGVAAPEMESYLGCGQTGIRTVPNCTWLGVSCFLNYLST